MINEYIVKNINEALHIMLYIKTQYDKVKSVILG